jgi:hypothetical protein
MRSFGASSYPPKADARILHLQERADLTGKSSDLKRCGSEMRSPVEAVLKAKAFLRFSFRRY